MDIFNDEMGQGAAEYILLFGGVIFFSLAALMIYNNYVQGHIGVNASQDISTVKSVV
jgi:hypothetical protein